VSATAVLHVAEVGAEEAEAVHAVIEAGFRDRPVLDPPAPALDETVASVAARLAQSGGLLVRLDGRPVGALLLDPQGPSLGLRRVAVVPDAQRQGVAAALASAAAETAVRRGARRLHLTARTELPETVRFWLRMGYRETARDGTSLTMARELPVECEVVDGDAMRELGRRLATLLRAGDLLILTGDLGAGKTTLTQGIGAGLGVRGDVTSPTFVISRVHPSLSGGPALVHADAYRLGGVAELDDLDLDVSVADSVTVVEWGAGLAEGLADDRLEIAITRTHGDEAPAGDPDAAEVRHVVLTPFGARWVGADLPDVVVAPVV
jgi:tRNA threonylcarbamoyladenosine biosynthesis protein TsaE